jgi:hypothetical protein
MYFYKYKVKYFDSIDEKERVEKGIVSGSAFKEAMDSIVQYYGEEELLDIQIKIIIDKFTGDAAETVLVTKREG